MIDLLRYAAFTLTPDGGNPAGVVLDASELSDQTMQSIAAEVGYSQTAFVVGGRDDHARRYSVRYFSPLAEVAFCGHATIATSVALAEREGEGALLFETVAGDIAVETSADALGIVATLRSVPTSSVAASKTEVARALRALRWSASELGSLPPHVAFGGNHHLVLEAASRERLRDLDYDFDALASLMTDRGWLTLQLIYVESDLLIHSRNPFPVGGVVEDPASGSAAAALGGYLRTIGRVPEPVTITIRQGQDMGRPSELLVDVDPRDLIVRVSGRAVPLAF